MWEEFDIWCGFHKVGNLLHLFRGAQLLNCFMALVIGMSMMPLVLFFFQQGQTVISVYSVSFNGDEVDSCKRSDSFTRLVFTIKIKMK